MIVLYDNPAYHIGGFTEMVCHPHFPLYSAINFPNCASARRSCGDTPKQEYPFVCSHSRSRAYSSAIRFARASAAVFDRPHRPAISPAVCMSSACSTHAGASRRLANTFAAVSSGAGSVWFPIFHRVTPSRHATESCRTCPNTMCPSSCATVKRLRVCGRIVSS